MLAIGKHEALFIYHLFLTFKASYSGFFFFFCIVKEMFKEILEGSSAILQEQVHSPMGPDIKGLGFIFWFKYLLYDHIPLTYGV